MQGFPLSYASAIAITQARELAGGKRQVRCLISLPPGQKPCCVEHLY